MKHIIALLATALAFYAMYYMYTLDVEVQKLQDIKLTIKNSEIKVKVAQTTRPLPKEEKVESAKDQVEKKNKELDEKLAALKRKAGNLAAFKVSKTYKQKCSSCHGVNGKGTIGPNLVGKSKEYILSNLKEFKSGTRKNYVMYGLLQKLDDNDLDALASEIATFQEKWDKLEKGQ